MEHLKSRCRADLLFIASDAAVAVRETEKRFYEFLEAAFPAGQRAYYSHGDRLIEVEVVKPGARTVLVRNNITGREYRLDLRKLLWDDPEL